MTHIQASVWPVVLFDLNGLRLIFVPKSSAVNVSRRRKLIGENETLSSRGWEQMHAGSGCEEELWDDWIVTLPPDYLSSKFS